MTVRDCCDPWTMKTFHIFRRPSLELPLRVTAMGTSGQCQALYWETRTDWLQVFMTSKSWAIAVTSTWDFVALWERATKASRSTTWQAKKNHRDATNELFWPRVNDSLQGQTWRYGDRSSSVACSLCIPPHLIHLLKSFSNITSKSSCESS
jgi:hypothetical protein